MEYVKQEERFIEDIKCPAQIRTNDLEGMNRSLSKVVEMGKLEEGAAPPASHPGQHLAELQKKGIYMTAAPGTLPPGCRPVTMPPGAYAPQGVAGYMYPGQHPAQPHSLQYPGQGVTNYRMQMDHQYFK